MKHIVKANRKNTGSVTAASLPTLSADQAKRVFDGLDVNPLTRKDYQSRIADFIHFAETRGGLYSNIVLDYKTDLSLRLTERGALSISTRNKYLTTAKVYLKLSAGLFGTPEIGQDVRNFTQSKKHKKTGLNEQEVKRIYGAIYTAAPGIRNTRRKALFSFLAFQGLRQVEIRRLKITDVNLKEGTAKIQGKGLDDTDIIYLHPETVKAVGEYLTDLKSNGKTNGYLFQALGNRKTSSGMITTMTIQREIKDLFNSLGIEGKTVHGFRHYFVTKLLKSFDPITVQKFSRHASLEMLIVYNDNLQIKDKAAEVFNALAI